MADASTDPGTPTTGLAATSEGFRSWPGPFRWAAYAAGIVVLAIVAALVTGVVLVRRPFPQTTGEISIPGLESQVQVLRDDHGIPQIYADSMHDLMLAQGFVHAQERFFEMDVRRHATAGTLAELFGEAGVESDLVTRTLGWRRVAERELRMLRPDTRNALDAYAEGVNAYLADRSLSELSLEYTLLDVGGLDYQPADWTAVDSIAWLKAMAWDLRSNLDEELDRALTAAAVGSDRAAELFPAYPYRTHPPIVEQGAVVDGRQPRFDQDADPAATASVAGSTPDAQTVAALADVKGVLDAVPPLVGEGDGLGSNAWVVDGDHTASGAPLLANDPHLGVSLPGVWMQVGLHCRTISAGCPLDVAGFSFSGVPGVVIGHNRDIAWGFTNLAPDVADLYIEQVQGDTFTHGGKQLPLQTRTETIEVDGGDDITFQVRSTGRGPILTDIAATAAAHGIDLTDDGVVEKTALQGPAVSLAWTALDPHNTADALFLLDQASDWDSFHEALRSFAVPGQNVVYADRAGHIGYQATGVVPLRKKGHDGRLPADGTDPADDWSGSIPYDALPRLLDPEGGVITTANQAVIDPARYPYPITDDYDLGYRSTRIRDLLEADDALTPDRMAQVQLDDWSAIAEVLTPYLLKVRLPDGYYSDGQRLLQTWNYRNRAESSAAAYFNVVWSQVLRRTFADELPEGVQPDGSDRWFAVAARILPKARSHWWDDVTTEQVERRDDILAAAMEDARDELTRRESPIATEWRWGQIHELELRSATLGESGIGVIERLFNRGGWEAAGGGSIVNATSWDAREGYQVTAAPSMRMIVPLDDLDQARWISLTGVSGHAFNPHYTDQTDLWARGETLPWAFTQEAVEAAAEDTLVLEPAD